MSPFDLSIRIGPIVFGADHITAVVVVPIVLAALAWFLGRSDLGIAIRAAADSSERALLLGVPVRRLSQVTWMVAAGLSGLGAVLTVPIVGTNLGGVAGPASLLGPLAAAVVARMERLGVAFAAALGHRHPPPGRVLELPPGHHRRRRPVPRRAGGAADPAVDA